MGNYLYNGVELPALPEWDNATKPYATILSHVADGVKEYWLKFRTTKQTVVSSGGAAVWTGCDYILRDGVWVDDSAGGGGTVVWANHDVYYSDSVEEVGGTLYLAASDPIPVNPAPTLDPTALLMGWQVGNRIRGGA